MNRVRSHAVTAMTATSVLLLIAAVLAVLSWGTTMSRHEPLPVPSGDPQIAPRAPTPHVSTDPLVLPG